MGVHCEAGRALCTAWVQRPQVQIPLRPRKLFSGYFTIAGLEASFWQHSPFGKWLLTWHHRSGNGQGKKILQGQGNVREFYSGSGKISIFKKSQGNLSSKVRRNISGQMGAKDCCNRRLEAAIISDILHLFGQANLTFIRKKSGKLDREFWRLMSVATMIKKCNKQFTICTCPRSFETHLDEWASANFQPCNCLNCDYNCDGHIFVSTAHIIACKHCTGHVATPEIAAYPLLEFQNLWVVTLERWYVAVGIFSSDIN